MLRVARRLRRLPIADRNSHMGDADSTLSDRESNGSECYTNGRAARRRMDRGRPILMFDWARLAGRGALQDAPPIATPQRPLNSGPTPVWADRPRASRFLPMCDMRPALTVQPGPLGRLLIRCFGKLVRLGVWPSERFVDGGIGASEKTPGIYNLGYGADGGRGPR